MPLGKHILGTVNEKKIYGTAKVGEKGQIVIPKKARDLFDIKSGDSLLVLCDKTCGIIITKLDALEGAAEKIIDKAKGVNDVL